MEGCHVDGRPQRVKLEVVSGNCRGKFKLDVKKNFLTLRISQNGQATMGSNQVEDCFSGRMFRGFHFRSE